MLPEKYRCAVIVSKAPLIQRGFVAIMDDAFLSMKLSAAQPDKR